MVAPAARCTQSRHESDLEHTSDKGCYRFAT